MRDARKNNGLSLDEAVPRSGDENTAMTARKQNPRKPVSATRFAALLEAAGLAGVADAARALDMSERMIHYYASGARPVTAVVVLALQYLAVSRDGTARDP